MNQEMESPIVIYEDTDKAVEVRLDADQETVWLTQRQMAELFGKDVRTVNEHVQNVYSEGELEREATIRDFRIVRQEGARQVSRDIEHYNLDVIISVGWPDGSYCLPVQSTHRLNNHFPPPAFGKIA